MEAVGDNDGCHENSLLVAEAVTEDSARRPKVGRRGKSRHQREEDGERNGEGERVLSIGH